jgi:hypothetical protein
VRKVCLILIMAARVVLGVATSAQASTVSCPSTGGDRQVQLEPLGSVCLQSGNGNGTLNSANSTAVFNAVTWTLLDSSENSSAGTEPSALTLTGTSSSGEFGFAPAMWNTYSRVVLAFQFAKVGNDGPDWVAFELVPNTSNGTWTITPDGQSLDHANLYGVKGLGDAEVSPAAVPEPMSLALLGAGLTFGARSLRRKK